MNPEDNELFKWMMKNIVFVKSPEEVFRLDTGERMSVKEFHEWGARAQYHFEETGALPS